MKRLIVPAIVAIFISVVSHDFVSAAEIKQDTWVDFDMEMDLVREDVRICTNLVAAGSIIGDVEKQRQSIFNALQCNEVIKKYVQMREERNKTIQVGKPGEHQFFSFE